MTTLKDIRYTLKNNKQSLTEKYGVSVLAIFSSYRRGEERKESDIAWKVNIKTVIERGYDLDIKNRTKPQEEKEYNSAELMEMLDASFDKSHKLLNQLQQAVK